ncbi:MAG: GNAT family N-acetyltransferase [Phycisphaerales bacterium]|nr:GNAT family N-acetyltransferase [Phycisphaerales bacterium]
MLEFEFRRANENDAEALCPLLSELGYPTGAGVLRGRLRQVLSASGEAVFVAAGGGGLCGVAHVCVSARLLSEPDAEILALVVAPAERRRGVATQLVNFCVEWACSRGRTRVRVRCNTKRTEAHRFYEKLGFRASKDQRVFELGS